jgi:hypothetical protein
MQNRALGDRENQPLSEIGQPDVHQKESALDEEEQHEDGDEVLGVIDALPGEVIGSLQSTREIG